MKTVEELYGEIVASDELKKAFVGAMKENKVEEFLRGRGCDATVEEIQEFVDSFECSHKGNTCNCSNTCIRDCC